MPLIQTPNGENFQVHVVLFQTNDDLLQLGFNKEVAQRIEEADSSRSLYRFFSASDAMPNKDDLDPSTECIAVHLNEDDEILITEMEHHSNIVPWQLIAKKN